MKKNEKNGDELLVLISKMSDEFEDELTCEESDERRTFLFSIVSMIRCD